MPALWKKRSLDLLNTIATLDKDCAGLSLPELRRATGYSRPILMWSLSWLVETGAATVRLDHEKRRLWTAVSGHGQAAEQTSDLQPLHELALDSDAATILSELVSE